MVKRTPKALHWNNVKADDGSIVGSYVVDGDIIRVRRTAGGEKVTQSSATGHNEGLARLMLTAKTGWDI